MKKTGQKTLSTSRAIAGVESGYILQRSGDPSVRAARPINRESLYEISCVLIKGSDQF